MQERDILHHDKIQSLQHEIKIITEENEELRYNFSKLKKKSKYQDEKYEGVHAEIENSIKLLELREKEVEEKIVQKEFECRQLKAKVNILEADLISSDQNLKQISSKNQVLHETIQHSMVPAFDHQYVLQKNEDLQKLILEKMVSSETHEELLQKYNILKAALSTEYVTMDDYNRLQDKYNKAKIIMEEEMISKESWNDLSLKYNHLEEVNHNMVGIEKYQLVKAEKLTAIQERELLETSARVLEESKYIMEKKLKEQLEAINELRNENGSLRNQVNHLTPQNEELVGQMIEMEKEVELSRNQIKSLENEKGMLLVQLGNTKSILSREMNAKSKLGERLDECLKKEDASKHEAMSLENQYNLALDTQRVQYEGRMIELQSRCYEWMAFVDRLTGEIQHLNLYSQPERNTSAAASDIGAGTASAMTTTLDHDTYSYTRDISNKVDLHEKDLEFFKQKSVHSVAVHPPPHHHRSAALYVTPQQQHQQQSSYPSSIGIPSVAGYLSNNGHKFGNIEFNNQKNNLNRPSSHHAYPSLVPLSDDIALSSSPYHSPNRHTYDSDTQKLHFVGSSRNTQSLSLQFPADTSQSQHSISTSAGVISGVNKFAKYMG